ncbi:hypothetical protein ABDE16_04285 [Streptomyces sp. BRB040]|uniref:hypothetical protein n=1 Tax=Streptomyces sp. BRB040 TaxID=3142634 RepID=UPI0031F66FC7
MGTRLVRVLGAATAAYSVAITVRPAWLARPCGLTAEDGTVPASTATLIRAVGARDTAIGLVMCLGRGPRVLQTASACRVAADLSDAVLFGRALTGRQRTEVAGFAAGWGTLCAVAAVGLRRPGGPAESAL